MVAQRLVVRSLVGAALLGFLHVSFVGCGSSDENKTSRETDAGGEAGEESGSGGSRAGSSPTAGKAGSTSQAGSLASEGGVAGTAGPDDRAGSGGEGAGGPGDAGASAGGTSGGSESGGGAPPGGGETSGGAGAENGGEASGGAAGGGSGEPCASVGSRISMTFDASNAERVTGLTWVDSDGATTVNLAVAGGSGACGDPTEFFGSSYGAPEGSTPLVIYAGTRATAVACGLDRQISSQPTNCTGAAQIPASTQYHFYDGAKASQVRISRQVTFDENSPNVTATALRTWQPRVSRTTFPDTIYPSTDSSSVTKVTVGVSCPGDCILPTNANWNKQWFAMVGGPDGLAVIVRRDPSLTTPINLTMNWDGFSVSNLSSFVWPKPAEGFKAPLEEVEYLCLADLKSWPQTERDAAQLPAFCGP